MNDTLQRLFRHKAWANDELLNRLAGLGAVRRLTVTGLAIKALSHCYIVDRIFAAHLRRKGHAYISVNAATVPPLDALSADIRQSDQEYVEYVATLGSDQLAERIDFAFTDGAPGCMSREEMLMHLITHGAAHRGQVSAVMLLNALPATKDGFTTWLHKTEAATRRRMAVSD
jgi:uncharacterized damage-inducible protein DinB